MEEGEKRMDISMLRYGQYYVRDVSIAHERLNKLDGLHFARRTRELDKLLSSTICQHLLSR